MVSEAVGWAVQHRVAVKLRGSGALHHPPGSQGSPHSPGWGHQGGLQGRQRVKPTLLSTHTHCLGQNIFLYLRVCNRTEAGHMHAFEAVSPAKKAKHGQSGSNSGTGSEAHVKTTKPYTYSSSPKSHLQQLTFGILARGCAPLCSCKAQRLDCHCCCQSYQT